MPSCPTSRILRPASLRLTLLLTAAALHAAVCLQQDTHDVTPHGADGAARATRRADAPRWTSHPYPRGRSRGRDVRATGSRDTNDADGRWCWYMGARHADGALVDTPEPCLRCRCARGALVCYLRVCPALPDSPPDGCLVHHARGSCCPNLRCSESLKRYGSAVGDGAARLDEDEADLAFPAPFGGGGCVLRGTLYAEGSAMSSSSACEHCFCIGGRQRCVRPSCLPPPPGCEPEPPDRASLSTATGCCPARYRCTRRHPTTHAPHLHQGTGCVVGGRRYPDGERVPGAGAGASSCDNCFCLRGIVRCLASTCAPALLGCTPLLKPGECCPHSYDCSTSTVDDGAPLDLLSVTDNFITSPKNQDRSFHGDLVVSESATKPVTISSPVAAKLRQTTDLPKKYKTTTRNGQFSLTPLKVTSAENQTNSQVQTNSTKSTTASSAEQSSSVVSQTTTSRDVTEKGAEFTSTATATVQTTPQEPNETMRIVINGTINCTSELSTSTFPVGGEPATIEEAEDRVGEVETEDYTFNPNDLITEGPGADSFTVNVSTLLRTNMSAATLPPVAEIEALINMSKKREDYDYDYGAATLPPSLPNLKIIPFVAADAVVEGTPSDTAVDQSYTPLATDRSDKFPAYLPSSTGSEEDHVPTYGADETQYAQHLDSLSSLLLSNGDESKQTSHRDSNQYAFVTSQSEFDTTDVGHPTQPPPHFVVGSHVTNLFSPPVRTEGGFLPKVPPIPDDYYGVSYRRPTPLTPDRTRNPPPTPPPIDIAHHAPSINFDKHKECISSEGLRVAPGEKIEGVGVGGGGSTACSRCMCTWGVLLCTDTCDPPPPRCTHAAPNSTHCCPLVCEDVKNSSTAAPPMTQSPSTTTAPPVSSTTDFRPVFTFETVHTESISNGELFSTTPATTAGVVVVHEKTVISPSQIRTERPTDRPDSTIENKTAHFEDLVKITSNYSSSSPSPSTTASSEMPSNSTAVVTLQESAEYEEQPEEQESEEEEEDEGFSFGSVLKLLLSDGYDTTTTKPYRHTTTTAKPSPVPTRMPTFTATVQLSTSTPAKASTSTSTRKPVVFTRITSTTTTSPSKTSPSFRPLVARPVLAPSISTPFSVSGGVKKGDHLMLGEVSAIERRPVTVRPFTPTTTTTTTTTRTPSSIEDNVIRDVEPAVAGAVSGGFGGGMLKLAGCNIYGRMYRVGRIISELSNACLQCMCTELGVQCHPLRC